LALPLIPFVAIRRFVRTIASQPAGFGDRHNLIAPTVSKASTGCATIGVQPEV